MSNTEDLPVTLARDFFFSVGHGRLSMQSRLADSKLEKITLQKRLELFKLVLKDEDTFERLLSSRSATQKTVDDYYHGLPLSDQFTKQANSGFISGLFQETVRPSKGLLVSNRILKILNDTINEFPKDAPEKTFFGICRMYLTGKETIREEDIKSATENAGFTYRANYHHVTRLIAGCTAQLMAIRQRANDEYEADKNARIIPEPYSPERLSSLNVNL